MTLDDVLQQVRSFAGRRHSASDAAKIKSILLGAANLLDQQDLQQVLGEIQRIRRAEPGESSGAPLTEQIDSSSGRPVRRLRPAIGAGTVTDEGLARMHALEREGLTPSEAYHRVHADPAFKRMSRDLLPGERVFRTGGGRQDADQYDPHDAFAVCDEVRKRTRKYAEEYHVGTVEACARVLDADPDLAAAYRASGDREPIRVSLNAPGDDLPSDPVEVRERMRREVRTYAAKHGVGLKTAFGAMRDLNPDLWHAYARS